MFANLGGWWGGSAVVQKKAEDDVCNGDLNFMQRLGSPKTNLCRAAPGSLCCSAITISASRAIAFQK